MARGKKIEHGLFHEKLAAAQRVIVNEAIDTAGGNRVRAAKLLGISRTRLFTLMRALNAYGTQDPTDPVTARILRGHRRARLVRTGAKKEG